MLGSCSSCQCPHLSLPICSTSTPKTRPPAMAHLAVKQNAAQTGCFPGPGGSGDVKATGLAPTDVLPQKLPDDTRLFLPGVESVGHGRMQHPLRLLVAGACAEEGEGSGGVHGTTRTPSPSLTTLTFLPEESGAGRLPAKAQAPGGLLPAMPRGWPWAAGLFRGGQGVPKEQAAPLVFLTALGRGGRQGMGDVAEVVVTCGGDGSAEQSSARARL